MNLCNKHIIDFACSLSSAQVTGWSLWLLWGSFTNLPQDHLIIHTAKFLTNVLLWGPFDCSPTLSSAQSQVGDTIWRRGDNWAKWMTGQCKGTWSWIFIQPVHSTTSGNIQLQRATYKPSTMVCLNIWENFLPHFQKLASPSFLAFKLGRHFSSQTRVLLFLLLIS